MFPLHIVSFRHAALKSVNSVYSIENINISDKCVKRAPLLYFHSEKYSDTRGANKFYRPDYSFMGKNRKKKKKKQEVVFTPPHNIIAPRNGALCVSARMLRIFH